MADFFDLAPVRRSGWGCRFSSGRPARPRRPGPEARLNHGRHFGLAASTTRQAVRAALEAAGVDPRNGLGALDFRDPLATAVEIVYYRDIPVHEGAALS